MRQQDLELENGNMDRFEGIYVAEDRVQVIVSTREDLIHAKNISAGARSVQCISQLSDSTKRQLLFVRSLTNVQFKSKLRIVQD